MRHVDSLSRNPTVSEKPNEEVLKIEQADWVLSGQLTDEKISQIREVLTKPPQDDYSRHVYKEYALRNGRIYRITARGLLWVVPREMRQHMVRAAHDEMGHFGVEKTLHRLCQHYWFPRMRAYVEKYIKCCISCLYIKKATGPKEGYLHPLEKVAVPFYMIHIDHIGPFPKSRHGKEYLITLVDSFTKFVVLKAVKSTATKFVIVFLLETFSAYGLPARLVCDQGSSFTSKLFKNFCTEKKIKVTFNAVATPSANGQNERFNRTILSALLTSTPDEDRWDEQVPKIQFAINTAISKATGKTPFEMLFGYQPRGEMTQL